MLNKNQQVLALGIYRYLAGTSFDFLLPSATSSYIVCMMYVFLAGSCSGVYPEAAGFYLH